MTFLFFARITDVLVLQCSFSHIATDLPFPAKNEPFVARYTVLGPDPVIPVHRDLKGKAGLVPLFRGFFCILFVACHELHNLVGWHPQVNEFLEDKIVEDKP